MREQRVRSQPDRLLCVHCLTLRALCATCVPSAQSKNCVLILDGASVHRTMRVVDACHRAGVLLYFLPPYCPDINPIEDAFKQAKQFMRINCKTLRDEEPEDQIKMALVSIQPSGARAAFRGNGPWL